MEPISICITTFKRRLDLFKSLVDAIKELYPDIEVLVAINGEHEEGIDEQYRSHVLSYISTKKNVIPIMFTEFRSLSKLWNNLVIFSKTNYNLILNDDLIFENSQIISEIQKAIEQIKLGLFTINRIDNVEFLLTDAQGSDLTILKTIKPYIEQKKIKKLFCETHNNNKSLYLGLNNSFDGFKEILDKNYQILYYNFGGEYRPKEYEINENDIEWDTCWEIK